MINVVVLAGRGCKIDRKIITNNECSQIEWKSAIRMIGHFSGLEATKGAMFLSPSSRNTRDRKGEEEEEEGVVVVEEMYPFTLLISWKCQQASLKRLEVSSDPILQRSILWVFVDEFSSAKGTAAS